MRLGHILRRARQMDERTLRAVAREIGIGVGALRRLERGRGTASSTLAKVMTWLLTRDEGAPRRRRREPELFGDRKAGA